MAKQERCNVKKLLIRKKSNMQISKNAQIRYFILDKCSSDFSRSFLIEDLLEKVNDVLIDQFEKGICLRTMVTHADCIFQPPCLKRLKY